MDAYLIWLKIRNSMENGIPRDAFFVNHSWYVHSWDIE
jgi:hypothetical protein